MRAGNDLTVVRDMYSLFSSRNIHVDSLISVDLASLEQYHSCLRILKKDISSLLDTEKEIVKNFIDYYEAYTYQKSDLKESFE